MVYCPTSQESIKGQRVSASYLSWLFYLAAQALAGIISIKFIQHRLQGENYELD
jgi:hypothetical protein